MSRKVVALGTPAMSVLLLLLLLLLLWHAPPQAVVLFIFLLAIQRYEQRWGRPEDPDLD